MPRHFFGRLEIISPLLSGQLPYQYGKSLKFLHPDAFPRRQKCVCGWAALGSLQRFPRPPSWIYGLPLRGGKGREGKRKGVGRERECWGEEGGKGHTDTSFPPL